MLNLVLALLAGVVTVAAPCTLPMLPILLVACVGQTGKSSHSMMALAYGGQAVTTRVRGIARSSPRLQQGFGVVVIAFAIASYFQYDTQIVAWLTAFYPTGQIGL